MRENIEDKRMVREARDSECNARSKAKKRRSGDISNMGKGMDRNQEESGTAGAYFASAKTKVGRLTS